VPACDYLFEAVVVGLVSTASAALFGRCTIYATESKQRAEAEPSRNRHDRVGRLDLCAGMPNGIGGGADDVSSTVRLDAEVSGLSKMPRMTPDPIDRAERLVRTLGWSHGDWWTDGVWTVYAHRDADKIITRAHLPSEAWDEALRQAGIVQWS